MNYIIDIAFTLIFLLIVIVCFFRGFLKTIATFLKLVIAAVLAYFIAPLLGGFIGNIIPLDQSSNINTFIKLIPGVNSGTLQLDAQGFLGTVIAFILVFILIYFILTFIVNFLNLGVKRFRIAKIINRIGGGILGIIIGGALLFALSYIVAISLTIYSPTLGISTIQKSIFLKTFILDASKNLFTSLMTSFSEKYAPALKNWGN